MKRIMRLYIVLCIAAAGIFLFGASAAAAEKEETIIRVGFPSQAGLMMKDDEGNYSGYTYDYLKEVAQYTGWSYEFVEIEGSINEQLTTLLDMLQNGEIDLMGAMKYSEALAECYDFPSESYGNAYTVIAVKEDEDRIDEFNITDYKNIRIALLTAAKNQNELFYKYAELNGISYEVVWCDDDTSQYDIVESGKADALLAIDVSLEKRYRPIAKISPSPFYFATTKGNTAVINELNRAISYISEVNPMLQSTLHNEYFARTSSKLILNSAEREYIQEHPVLRVLVHDGFGPLQYYDKDGVIQGVAKDLLENIAQKAGWRLEYIYKDTYEEYESAIRNKEADVILTVPYDYDTALIQDILLSSSYMESERVLVAREGVDVLDLSGKKQAVYKGTGVLDDVEPVQYYDSEEQSLQAVEKGICDYTYSNSYSASFYQRKDQQQHTIVYPMTSGSIKYSIGIIDKNNRQLSAILNKGIRSVDSRELESYIYNNAQVNQSVTLKSYFRNNPYAFLLFTVSAAAVLLILFYSYYRNQMKMKKQIELENRRYRYLSDMLKEVTFTYDYRNDVMLLSQEGIKIFETAGRIDQYSKYQSKIMADERVSSLYSLLVQKKDIVKDQKLKLPGKEPEWYRVVIKVIMDGNQAVSAVGRIQRIHEEKLEKDRLVQRSMLDGLTNIYNSAASKKEIAERLKAGKDVFALAIIDLDGFKAINDLYGHYIGDRVLTQTARALKEIFSGDEVVGRLGGDEFIVCMPYRSRSELEDRCRSLFRNLSGRKESQGDPIPTVSIGISVSLCGENFDSLYQRADKLLYSVKNSGKNNFCIDESIPE